MSKQLRSKQRGVVPVTSDASVVAMRCWQYTWPGVVDWDNPSDNDTDCEGKTGPCIEPFVLSSRWRLVARRERGEKGAVGYLRSFDVCFYESVRGSEVFVWFSAAIRSFYTHSSVASAASG